jgi:hypothetical protein
MGFISVASYPFNPDLNLVVPVEVFPQIDSLSPSNLGLKLRAVMSRYMNTLYNMWRGTYIALLIGFHQYAEETSEGVLPFLEVI